VSTRTIRSLGVLLHAAERKSFEGGVLVLFVGDDWAEEHHDIEVQDETGKVLAKKRLP